MVTEPVRWGILSAANIVVRSFLPALSATGDGVPFLVGARDGGRAKAFADEHGIQQGVAGYDAVLADDRVEAVYIPLPNGLHAEWTIKALRAGKPVLCEKPLCGSAEETQHVLDVARETGTPLWEAFVFPFHTQMERVRQALRDGAIGSAREVQTTFTFPIENRDDIRLSPELAGGALADVGCYCVALGRYVFESDPLEGFAWARRAPEGVDEEVAGVLLFSDNRRLTLSCGFALPDDTFSRVIGTGGEIQFSNPWHPTEADSFEIVHGQDRTVESSNQDEPSFTDALRHIHRVVRGQETPRHLALDEALGNAIGLDLLRRSAHTGRREMA